MAEANRCYIFGAAPIEDYGYINIKKEKGDMIICADGGLKHLKRLSLQPDVVIGDFDSYEKPEDGLVIEYPSKKDETDMFLAVKAGLSSGYKLFYMYGGLDGRFDHALANISVLFYLNTFQARGVLLNEKNEVYTLCGEESLVLKRKPGYKISLLSFSDKTCGVTTNGLYYPLEKAVLTNEFPFGISNEFTQEKAQISITSGKLVIVLSKD